MKDQVEGTGNNYARATGKRREGRGGNGTKARAQPIQLLDGEKGERITKLLDLDHLIARASALLNSLG